MSGFDNNDLASCRPDIISDSPSGGDMWPLKNIINCSYLHCMMPFHLSLWEICVGVLNQHTLIVSQIMIIKCACFCYLEHRKNDSHYNVDSLFEYCAFLMSCFMERIVSVNWLNCLYFINSYLFLCQYLKQISNSSVYWKTLVVKGWL